MNTLPDKLVAMLLSLILLIGGLITDYGNSKNDYAFSADTAVRDGEMTNLVSNINAWDMGTQFIGARNSDKNDIFKFVKYVQLMQCTGGTPERDLFENPLDTSVLDDYEFERLIENCRGILALGAKPHLKLGGVPVKFTSGYEYGAFGMNKYPPDDWNVYYNYIKAIGDALVAEFGADEVLTWRFGVMTEYENGDWFMAKSGTPEDSYEAYCHLYDCTAEALIDSVGANVFVGAHAMAVTEGLWDEADFIRHCGTGTNYMNGGTGTRLCFLSGSFYDMKPGEYTSGKTMPETIAYLRATAEECGLANLIYGIDEGRIYGGTTSGSGDSQLLSRTCGYTYQAAYDARLLKQAVGAGMDYLSSWGYLSNGVFSGNPTVSYHVAENIASFSESAVLQVKKTAVGKLRGAEVEALCVYDEATDTVRVMLYNFKNDLSYSDSADISLDIKLPGNYTGALNVTSSRVDDDCNYFDEWCEDRVTYGITDDCFTWSPDDPMIDSGTTLTAQWARDIYFNELYSKYTACSVLTPKSETVTSANGLLTLKTELEGNTVLFYEITK